MLPSLSTLFHFIHVYTGSLVMTIGIFGALKKKNWIHKTFINVNLWIKGWVEWFLMRCATQWHETQSHQCDKLKGGNHCGEVGMVVCSDPAARILSGWKDSGDHNGPWSCGEGLMSLHDSCSISPTEPALYRAEGGHRRVQRLPPMLHNKWDPLMGPDQLAHAKWTQCGGQSSLNKQIWWELCHWEENFLRTNRFFSTTSTQVSLFQHLNEQQLMTPKYLNKV